MEKIPQKNALIKHEPVQGGDVSLFIQQAIAANVPVETLERLFALKERYDAQKAKEAFVLAMAKFQATLSVIKKEKKVLNKDGKTIRYRYAPLDSIVAQVKKPLGDNGLAFSIRVENDEKFLTAICRITHEKGHSEESQFRVPIGSEEYMNDVQKYGARSTFAKRYAFCNALGILTGDEDTDAQNAETPKAKGNPTEPEMYEDAKKKILACANEKTLASILENLKKSKVYAPEHKKELVQCVVERIKDLLAAQGN